MASAPPPPPTQGNQLPLHSEQITASMSRYIQMMHRTRGHGNIWLFNTHKKGRGEPIQCRDSHHYEVPEITTPDFHMKSIFFSLLVYTCLFCPLNSFFGVKFWLLGPALKKGEGAALVGGRVVSGTSDMMKYDPGRPVWVLYLCKRLTAYQMPKHCTRLTFLQDNPAFPPLCWYPCCVN